MLTRTEHIQIKCVHNVIHAQSSMLLKFNSLTRVGISHGENFDDREI